MGTEPAVSTNAPCSGAFYGRERNWLVWFDEQWHRWSPRTRAVAALYFRPTRIEQYRSGLIYRVLGIRFIALVIPTGGMLWRRLFRWDGWSFGLGASSLRRARDYRYNTCVFEMLHTGAFLLMLPDGIASIQSVYWDGILKFLIAGILFNIYPLMLQRYNRLRITNLIARRERRLLVRLNYSIWTRR
jgi:hypothetical protein